MANGTIYGLNGAVSGEEEHAMAIARRLRVCQVDVNGGQHNSVAQPRWHAGDQPHALGQQGSIRGSPHTPRGQEHPSRIAYALDQRIEFGVWGGMTEPSLQLHHL
ncbi:hypothetical protein ABZY05_45355 [Streptomyces canus]|uniref:hypothetical protein n=1 Tax=Streptomyces canus TaxID=58343 RepID=UPI0033B3205A